MTFASSSKTGYVYALHWDDGIDLDALDDRVALDQYTDDDFVNSIKTQIGRTKCFECGQEWLTLDVPPADPYLNAPGLAEQKLHRRYQRGGVILNCPTCNTRLRLSVVKIFG